MLRETAQMMVRSLLPEPTEVQKLDAMRAAMREMNAHGITSFIDAAVGVDELEVYRELEQSGDLSARVTTSLTYGVFGLESMAEFR